jgi:ech hydrogenase subunit A
VLLALIPSRPFRHVLVRLAALVLALVAIYTAWTLRGAGTKLYSFDAAWVEPLMIWGGLALALYMLWECRKITRAEWWIPVVIALQEGLLLWLELGGSEPKVAKPFLFDNLSAVMVVIIGVVGSLICVYALGYMHDFAEHHRDVKDRRHAFFFVLFAFLAAMMGIVVCNHLAWLYVCWEVTTVSSFWLIGYTQTPEATRNSFRALGLNAVGGLGFVLALAYLAKLAPAPLASDLDASNFALSTLMQGGQTWPVLIPVCLLAFAGLAKAAQMPFSSWLLGAMVAPTPVSALLHSSTMVKAGVYLILRFGKVFQGQMAGDLLALVGGVTFLVASLQAVTQSNAKRVLAYSTIANLGLIVACAGVGTPEALWAGVLLLVFHAVSKGLLFIAVGTIEQKIGSRDIEDMEGLLVTKPFLAVVILTGLVGMFLAPFGMLISKWACMKAFVDSDPALACLLAFGSAPTLFYYAKWMGKVVSVPSGKIKADYSIPWEEKLSLGILTLLTAAACALFPLLGSAFINPWLGGEGVQMPLSNLIIMLVMLGFVGLLPLSLFFPGHMKLAPRYLSGVNRSHDTAFTGSFGSPKPVSLRNYYLHELLSERWLAVTGSLVAGCLIAAMFWRAL